MFDKPLVSEVSTLFVFVIIGRYRMTGNKAALVRFVEKALILIRLQMYRGKLEAFWYDYVRTTMGRIYALYIQDCEHYKWVNCHF
ncbi:hypothetical protein E3N88_18008 [Mikania micrantha]|uniref:Uncharacterized protein n=1 Tax=Mikania micrantha TaxID=192012 RepID=A0A5N6NTD7_9ASTR|nr:hypothetical protein E3N88_18008 [Mikania micrantha]